MENIVIIDHQADRMLSYSHTELLLEKYIEQGSDVWKCDGAFKHKENMWSDIIHDYTNSSRFVFPLDVDELIAVKTKKDTTLDLAQDNEYKETEKLTWDAQDFSNALNKLPDSGMPFKMEGGLAYPTDCGDIRWDMSGYFPDGEVGGTGDDDDLPDHIQFVGRRRTRQAMCRDKAFFCSKDFYKTDTGNHEGQTHRYKNSWLKNCTKVTIPAYTPNKGWRDEAINKHHPDQASDLYLLHLQQVNFEGWLIHALRGAAGRSFNRFDKLANCSNQAVSVHYCTGWEKLLKARFDPNEMKKIYRQDVCALVVNLHYPFPVGHLWNKS